MTPSGMDAIEATFEFVGVIPKTGLKAIRALQKKVLTHEAIETVEIDGIFQVVAKNPEQALTV